MVTRSGLMKDATAVLSQMVLERAITNFVSNFEAVRLRSAWPHVRIWIREEDELSVARIKSRIEAALSPFLGSVKVDVEPDPWIPRGRSRGGKGQEGGPA